MSKHSISKVSRHRIFHINKLLSSKDIRELIKRANEQIVYDIGSNYESIHFDRSYIVPYLKKIKNIGDKEVNDIVDLIDSDYDTHGTCYRNSDNSMESHYDGWSDWNLLFSIGDSSDLITGRDKLTLNSGDVVLFNGGRIRHQVKIHKGKGIKGSKYRRITIQHRHWLWKRDLKAEIKKDKKYPARYG